MKREAKILLCKATDSLVQAIAHFNGITSRGRTTSVMILLDHSFEMLLKAAIIHNGGKIRRKGAAQTIGFDACVRLCLTAPGLKCLNDNQALTLQAINGIRDACYHYHVDVSEPLLYLHAQAGVTMFRDLSRSVFGIDLHSMVPDRVLPVSVTPPRELSVLFDQEVAEIRKLLAPGKRRVIEATARLRSLAILDNAMQGKKELPTDDDLHGTLNRLKNTDWGEVFPGVASLDTSSGGAGQTLEIRLDKKEGIPVHLVAEGTPGAAVVAVKRVNELDFYSLRLDALAEKLNLSGPRALALIMHLGLQNDARFFREISLGGKTKYKRYSPQAIIAMREALKTVDMNEVWQKFGPMLSGRRPKLARR